MDKELHHGGKLREPKAYFQINSSSLENGAVLHDVHQVCHVKPLPLDQAQALVVDGQHQLVRFLSEDHGCRPGDEHQRSEHIEEEHQGGLVAALTAKLTAKQVFPDIVSNCEERQKINDQGRICLVSKLNELLVSEVWSRLLVL